jgi:CHAD domain-containing protein
MADRKWIDNLHPEMSLAGAARHVLQARLEVVADALPLAIEDANRDPEHVHRLRVATRRADAALRIFRANLPEKVFKTARRRLRRIRRAAGAARDWDVFLIELNSRHSERPAIEHAGLDFLAGYSFAQRWEAHPEIEAASRKQPEFATLACAIVTSVHDGEPEATLIQLARPLLSSLLIKLQQTVEGDLSEYARLHQVRIAGKRLRYAMEVFADSFPPPFRESIYPQIEEMQEMLGRANDSQVATSWLQTLRDQLRETAGVEWKRLRAGVEDMLRFHKSRVPQQRRRFLAWLKRWNKGPRVELAALLHAHLPSSVVSP